MDKRYQVFVSSTFNDLEVERKVVMQSLMKIDCIPAGMEMFPALDEEQFQFIKKVIDDCDYYLLIIGGRYGSLTEEGISYTEKEYDYAIEQGKKVIALLHKHPEELPAKHTESDAEKRSKLEAFRQKVSTKRLVEYWENGDQLARFVVTSLMHTMKVYPAVGWVRADKGDSSELLLEINDLRKSYDDLIREYHLLKDASVELDNSEYACGEDLVEIKGTCLERITGKLENWSRSVSWNTIISFIGPHLYSLEYERNIKGILADAMFSFIGVNPAIYYKNEIDTGIFQMIKIQLLALNLIEVVDVTGLNLQWKITDKGKRAVTAIIAIPKNKEPAEIAD